MARDRVDVDGATSSAISNRTGTLENVEDEVRRVGADNGQRRRLGSADGDRRRIDWRRAPATPRRSPDTIVRVLNAMEMTSHAARCCRFFLLVLV